MMIQEQVKKTIDKRCLIEKRDKVLVCVSGGPDSVALLHLMLELKEYYGIELVVAHLDHMLRGRQSAADANFVKKLTSQLDIPFIMERIDVKSIAESNKISIEQAAREARYDFYQRAAEKVGADKIATGHNMDDQAETVLMRLIRGSGSLGLSGIPYKRRLGNSWVIRPLLDIKREDIERYLQRHRFPSRLDASNLKPLYLRNRVRHVLFPLLEKQFNPKIKENLVLVAKNLEDEFDYLNRLANRLCNRITKETEHGIEINIESLLRQHVALQRLIVRQIIHRLKGELRKITYRHWQEIESMVLDAKRKSVSLPNGLKVVKTEKMLIFTKSDRWRRGGEKFKRVVKLRIPQEVVIPQLKIKVCSEVARRTPKFIKGQRRKSVEYIDGDSIKRPLKIRTWRKGDRIKPLGMKYYKKLHDIFIDEKVPREMRDRIPLIVDRNKILWAAGVKLSEDCRVDKDTKRVIKLSIRPYIRKNGV